TLPNHLLDRSGGVSLAPGPCSAGKVPATASRADLGIVETRILALNADPVFQDRALGILDENPDLEIQVVRSLSEAVSALLGENFDGLIIEGESTVALEQATNMRQHFPSLTILCLLLDHRQSEIAPAASEQNIALLSMPLTNWGLRANLQRFVRSLDSRPGTVAAEGIDPGHS